MSDDTLLSDLREDFRDSQLTLAFQPQIDMRSGATLNFEALTRWKHYRRRNVPPSDFIPLIEGSDLAGPFFQWTLEESLKAHLAWEQAGFNVGVAVNLSGANLNQDGTVAAVVQALHQTKVDPRKLTLELTEGFSLVDTVRARHVLGNLQALGVRTSIDDFGTGFASYTYLLLPINQVKIDVHLVQVITSDPKSAIVVGSIIQLAHDLGLESVAEGVEDEETFEALKARNCDAMQGFLRSRPLTLADSLTWLKSEASH